MINVLKAKLILKDDDIIMNLTITLACFLMAMSICAFYCIAYKRKENMIIASLAMLFYILVVICMGRICLNLKSICIYVFNDDFSTPVFDILFSTVKVIFLLYIPMPVVSAYYRVKKNEKGKQEEQDND